MNLTTLTTPVTSVYVQIIERNSNALTYYGDVFFIILFRQYHRESLNTFQWDQVPRNNDIEVRELASLALFTRTFFRVP